MSYIIIDVSGRYWSGTCWSVGGFDLCTRPAGHDGPHVAHLATRTGPRAYAIWGGD